jgi:putative FmdB family regulatory protein
MPTYDYVCRKCGDFEVLRPLAKRNELCPCPTCGDSSTRTWINAPSLSCVSLHQRRSHETNERAQHVPRSSKDVDGTYPRLSHPRGCGCCNPALPRSKTVTAPDGSKTFPSKRPWMISH